MPTRRHSPSTRSDPDERAPDTPARHDPVLVEEVVRLLQPQGDGVYVDATLGLGGHTAALVDAGAGRVIGIDRDASAVAAAQARLEKVAGRVTCVHADYRDLPAVVAAQGVHEVDGVVADLGVSSMQLDDATRGFSFRRSGPLDMRMDRSSGRTAADLLATIEESELADVIWRFGEERHARRVARAVIRARDRRVLDTTGDLAAVVRAAAGGKGWQRIDPATRTFQAIRIRVNEELDGLDRFLADTTGLLRAGGRLVVITFHSLEDRIVKHTFRRLVAGDARLRDLTRKPIEPTDDERHRNPRARSAKLRAIEKIETLEQVA